ncbi:DNA replication/repair protein RecF [Aliifodinibius salicampi]|uniref:DNA replication and repair protein RecF n=1 Tax=Fodinibius salicampi TaxID=1920655 RepID=A0ABT3Q077_9BACT|nr:DNA replication/repair protein RecF [Fodinibius salicampi]MCW9713480.1 DNA replication/repair protein RecF [Fodinibius salicampi]
MRISNIRLQNFRNHTDTQVEWGAHMNVIIGQNGAGKTNLIDAIHYLCMSRSFVANSDRYVVNYDAPYFMIKGHFEGNIRSSFDVSCSYSRGEGKKIFVNESPLDRLSDLIGMVPVVVLSPGDKKLTSEGPKQRRSFIDSFISQISPRYLQDLMDFRKVRKQRNKLLQEFRGRREVLEAYLEPWNVQLVEYGSRIVAKRTEVLDQFQDFLAREYEVISGMRHKPHLEYQTFCEPSKKAETIEERYTAKLEDEIDHEIERELTLVGPHRDEIVFYLDDFELRKYGSQGQHRLFALSLKLAQLLYFSEELDDLPLFLLDDVFGDLDAQRTEVLLNALIEHAGQTFVTAANPIPFNDYITFDGEKNRKFEVTEGEVSRLQ